ncbi:MAG TPA: FHA domain-containing protein [Polyangiaceae bacterium]
MIAADGATHEMTLVAGVSRYVGRHSSTDITLHHESVGRRALLVRLDESGVVRIDDTGSGGGSMLNGVERPRDAVVRDGDELHVGALAFRVRLVS